MAGLASLDRILREGRSAKMQTILASQEVRDLEDLARTETIVCFRMDPMSAQTLAGFSEHDSEQQHLLADELTRLPPGQMIVLHGGADGVNG